MKKVTIDMRPEPFELPFFYTQLDELAKNRLNLWQKEGRTLGEGSVFVWNACGMELDPDSGEMFLTSDALSVSTRIEKPLHMAKDFIEYNERHADVHGGLNLAKCHEWGNAVHYDGSDTQPRSLLYGVKLCYNDGSVRIFKIESKQLESKEERV